MVESLSDLFVDYFETVASEESNTNNVQKSAQISPKTDLEGASDRDIVRYILMNPSEVVDSRGFYEFLQSLEPSRQDEVKELVDELMESLDKVKRVRTRDDARQIAKEFEQSNL